MLRYENPGLCRWRRHPTGERIWLDLRHGDVVVKNPDEATIAKLLMVARALNARVQGDDGEIYEVAGHMPRQPRVPFSTRVRSWLIRFRPTPRIEPTVIPFGPGQRVRDFRGQVGTVLVVDSKANHGMGSIRVRFDDGRELSFMALAHGLEVAEEDGA
jgi:hypothetical protein